AWHPDPTKAHEYRWWDGERWTEHVADNGQAAVDPLPSAPTGVADGASAGEASAGEASAGEASAAGTRPDTDRFGEAEPATDATTAESPPWQTPGATWHTPGATEA